MIMSSYLKGPSPWNEAAIIDEILDRPQAISDCIFNSSNGVLIGPFDEDGARAGMLDPFDEGVLLVAKRVLVHFFRIPKVIRGHVVKRVERMATASQSQPLHVPAFGPS